MKNRLQYVRCLREAEICFVYSSCPAAAVVSLDIVHHMLHPFFFSSLNAATIIYNTQWKKKWADPLEGRSRDLCGRQWKKTHNVPFESRPTVFFLNNNRHTLWSWLSFKLPQLLKEFWKTTVRHQLKRLWNQKGRSNYYPIITYIAPIVWDSTAPERWSACMTRIITVPIIPVRGFLLVNCTFFFFFREDLMSRIARVSRTTNGW